MTSQNQRHYMTDVARLVEHLNLKPHPEGGFYTESYRAPDWVTRSADGAQRASSTAIYYLLESGAWSAWHRIASDEIWHFYAGSPLKVQVLMPSKELVTHVLGPALEQPGCVYQAVVLAGCWFAAELDTPDSFALVGCTVAPGFEFSEFDLADGAQLLADYPQHAEVIHRLLR